MVALVLFQQFGVVFHVLPEAHGLGGAGLAGRSVGSPGEHARARAGLDHRREAVAHDLQVLRGVAQVLARGLLHFRDRAGDGVAHGLHEVRAVADAAVGQRGLGRGQLEHGEAVVTLPDAERHGLAGVPALHLRALVGIALPLGAGQHAAHLAIEVDARDLAEAQRFHEVVDGVHAHVHGQRVEVGVAGELDGAHHVHAAQAAFVAAEGVAAVGIETRVVVHLRGRALVQLQRAERHEWLVGGAGRIGAAQRAVEQRLVDGLVERLPVLRIDAFHEQVRIEGGLRYQGEHLTVARVDRHQRAAAVAEHVLHQLLQLDVERQHHGVARRGRMAREAPHRVAAGRGLHALHAGLAVQSGLLALLDAELADMVGAAVVGRVVGILDALLLALVDAADVADGVAADVAQRVVAEEPGLDVHAREAVALRGEARDLLVRQARADRQRLEAARLLHEPLEPAPVAGVDLHDLGEFVDRVLQAIDLRGRDLQGVGRVVGGQHHAVAVLDEPPVGHDGNDRGAVALGLVGEVFVAHHLQHEQARHDQAHGKQHHEAHDEDAQAEPREIGLGVAQLGHVGRAKKRKGLRAAGSRRGRAGGAAARAAPSWRAATAGPRSPGRSAPADPAGCRPRPCAPAARSHARPETGAAPAAPARTG